MPHFRTPPKADEYNPFYEGYVKSVPQGDLLEILATQKHAVFKMMSGLHRTQENYRYEAGKWTLREVFGHMIDTEWIFSYRLLRIARGDSTPLPGMDQDQFMEGANFSDRSMGDLLVEFGGLRTASSALIGSLSEEAFDRRGTASGFPVTARALAWIIAGHCQHHLTIIRERYL